MKRDHGVSFSQLTIDRTGGSRFIVFIDGTQAGVATRTLRGLWRPGPVLADRFPTLRRQYHLAADLQDAVRAAYVKEAEDE